MQPHYPLKLLCETLASNRTSFYYEPEPKGEEALKEAIAEVIRQWPTYGYRRVTAQLRRQGHQANHKRVLRLMREMGLTERPPARKVRTTDSEHSFPRYPNLVEDLTICRPEQVWVADITYVRVCLEELYLAILLDVYTRRLRGWNLSRGLNASLTLGALRKALGRGTPEIHHSDQGVQYACKDYVDALPQGVRISMTEKGEAWQNGYAERAIRTIKEECIRLEDYRDYADARLRIGTFLEDVYNHKRIHSALGYLTPAEFEATYYERRAASQEPLTPPGPQGIILMAGQTEAGSAEEQPARDNRPGKRREVPRGTVLWGSPPTPHLVDAPNASENLSLNDLTDFRV